MLKRLCKSSLGLVDKAIYSVGAVKSSFTQKISETRPSVFGEELRWNQDNTEINSGAFVSFKPRSWVELRQRLKSFLMVLMKIQFFLELNLT